MLNKAILMGRLTADPDVRQTNTGVSVTTFTLAVDRGYAKPGEEKQTDFIGITCWRNTADFVGKYFKKGQLVAVEGSIRTRNYTDNNGNKRYVTEVVANEVFFAEGKKNSDSAYTSPSPFSQPAAETYSQNTSSFEQSSSVETYTNVDFAGDDDLPF